MSRYVCAPREECGRGRRHRQWLRVLGTLRIRIVTHLGYGGTHQYADGGAIQTAATAAEPAVYDLQPARDAHEHSHGSILPAKQV